MITFEDADGDVASAAASEFLESSHFELRSKAPNSPVSKKRKGKAGDEPAPVVPVESGSDSEELDLAFDTRHLSLSPVPIASPSSLRLSLAVGDEDLSWDFADFDFSAMLDAWLDGLIGLPSAVAELPAAASSGSRSSSYESEFVL